MRICAGKHKSRPLASPKDNAVRPTSDKIRQAIFNMLNARGLVVDAIVIDAFCGTGALGLEALSQGASHCVFFDKSKESIALTKQNIVTLKEEIACEVFVQDVTKAKPRPEKLSPASLVFLDPPYHQDLMSGAINSLIESGWLNNDVYIVMEMAKDENISHQKIEMMVEKIYGDTKIGLAQLKNTN